MPFRPHRIPGGAVTGSHQVALLDSLQQDAAIAAREGRPLLAICCTHTNCAALDRSGRTEAEVWESFRSLPFPQDVVPVGFSLDVSSGAITVIGPEGSVNCAEIIREYLNVGRFQTRARLDAAFHGIGLIRPEVNADLATCLLQQVPAGEPTFCPDHQEEGIVIGHGIPGSFTHFTISSDDCDVSEALEIALGIFRSRGILQPFIAVSAFNDRTLREDTAAIRPLQEQVVSALSALDYEIPVHPILVVRSSGNLCLVK